MLKVLFSDVSGEERSPNRHRDASRSPTREGQHSSSRNYAGNYGDVVDAVISNVDDTAAHTGNLHSDAPSPTAGHQAAADGNTAPSTLEFQTREMVHNMLHEY
jgi:hypothetical protein